MSILNTSVSGMLANTDWLTTIAQNVANANTTGYKNVETDFSALVDSSQTPSRNSPASPRTTRGAQRTAGPGSADLDDDRPRRAGRRASSSSQDSSSNIYLTRNGSFVPDASGNLVNAAGYYLLGAPFGQHGRRAQFAVRPVEDQRRPTAAIPRFPRPPATLVANLPSTATVVARRDALGQHRRLAITPPRPRSSPTTISARRTRSTSISPRRRPTPGRPTPTTPRPPPPAAAFPTAPARSRRRR